MRTPDFDAALGRYLAGIKAKSDAYHAKHFPNLTPTTYTVDPSWHQVSPHREPQPRLALGPLLHPHRGRRGPDGSGLEAPREARTRLHLRQRRHGRGEHLRGQIPTRPELLTAVGLDPTTCCVYH